MFSALTRAKDWFLLPMPALDWPLHSVYVCDTTAKSSHVHRVLSSPSRHLGEFAQNFCTAHEQASPLKKKYLLSNELCRVAFDPNDDGALSEDEVEQYIHEQAVPWATKHDITEELFSFYCCVVSSVLFWQLGENWSSVSIDAALICDVLQKLFMVLHDSGNISEFFAGVDEARALHEKLVSLGIRNRERLQAR